MPKMNEPIVKNYKITLKSGLHIWGTQEALKIWGIDSQVIKNPLTGAPYIPWSSIKWKMRALLEMVEYSTDLKWDENIWPIQDPNHTISKTFWCSYHDKENNKNTNIGSRIIFEDFVLIDKWKQKFEELKSDFFEDKSENNVPRFLSWNAMLRHIERVPAWVEFEGSFVLVPEEGEYGITEEELKKELEKWIELLNSTYLWGWGSRWNGRIKIEEIKD